MGGTKLKAERALGKRRHRTLSYTRAELCQEGRRREVNCRHAGLAVTVGHPSADAHGAAGNRHVKCRKDISATDNNLEVVSIQMINKAFAVDELAQGEHV